LGTKSQKRDSISRDSAYYPISHDLHVVSGYKQPDCILIVTSLIAKAAQIDSNNTINHRLHATTSCLSMHAGRNHKIIYIYVYSVDSMCFHQINNSWCQEYVWIWGNHVHGEDISNSAVLCFLLSYPVNYHCVTTLFISSLFLCLNRFFLPLNF